MLSYATYLDSLFHDLDDETLKSCRVFPGTRGSQWGQKGYGAAVMQVVDVIAHNRGLPVMLADVAKFTYGEVPLINSYTRITPTLVLMRGMGYYESRGFVSDLLTSSATPKEMYAAATGVDLQWSHMIVTTPVTELLAAIRDFHTTVKALGASVPDFTHELYSERFCTDHATRAETLFMKPWTDNMVPLLSAGTQRNGKLDGVSYVDLSVRALAQAITANRIPEDVVDAEELNFHVRLLMKHVWERPVEIDMDGHYERTYPGSGLVKVLHESLTSDTPEFNAIVPNPQVPRGVPVVRPQPIPSDITVVFRSVPEEEEIPMVPPMQPRGAPL